MLDFDSLAEMECLDQGLTEPPPVPTNEGGWGWSALFGGALGLMLGRSDRPSVSVPEFAPAEGDFTPDEKDFLSQLWRFERELRDVRKTKTGSVFTFFHCLRWNHSSKAGANSFRKTRAIRQAQGSIKRLGKSSRLSSGCAKRLWLWTSNL